VQANSTLHIIDSLFSLNLLAALRLGAKIRPINPKNPFPAPRMARAAKKEEIKNGTENGKSSKKISTPGGLPGCVAKESGLQVAGGASRVELRGLGAEKIRKHEK
jgi:hypothetical protein